VVCFVVTFYHCLYAFVIANGYCTSAIHLCQLTDSILFYSLTGITILTCYPLSPEEVWWLSGG